LAAHLLGGARDQRALAHNQSQSVKETKNSPRVSSNRSNIQRRAVGSNTTSKAVDVDVQESEDALPGLALRLDFMVLVAALNSATVALANLSTVASRSGHGGDSEEDRGDSDEGEDTSEHD
jgi:hypothetical protein